MKRCWTIALAAALLLTVCACKDKTEAEPAPETTEIVEATATPAPAETELGKGVYENYSASFVGAERFTAADGSEALRVYFDFENRSADSVSASERLLYSAVQDGKTLNWAQSAEPIELEGNLTLRLQPGHSIRCVLQYALVSEATVAVSLSDSQGQSVSALISLQRLPGAPAEIESGETASEEPSTDLDAEGTLFDAYTVHLTGGEVFDSDEGRVIAVSLDFTNRANPESVGVWDCLWLYAYQDGVQLEAAAVEEGDFLVSAAAGETVSCTAPFLLRSDSPVLVEAYGFREEAPCAALVIPIGE